MREATNRVLGQSNCTLEAFSKVVGNVLQQYNADETLSLADIDTAIDTLQGGTSEWMDVLGFQALSENSGFVPAIQLLASKEN